MGLLDSLNIGASGLLTNQAALQVTGNNIANMATPGYARQQAILSPHGSSVFGPGLTAGGGVRLLEIRRLVDTALQDRLNDATSQMALYDVAAKALNQVESLMNEMTDTDLSSGLIDLFNSFSALTGNPADIAFRNIVIVTADTVVDRFDFISTGLDDVTNTLTEQLEGAVRDADRLCMEIADLNVQIVQTESGGGSAASLRDQRDRTLNELSTFLGVNSREDANGTLNVFVGSEQLVTGGTSRGLSLVPHAASPGDTPILKVSFTDNEGAVTLDGGQIAGIQNTRDGELAEIAARIDTLASEVIWQVNLLHSSGRSLEGLTDVTGSYLVDNPDVALNTSEAGLAFTPVNGSFNLLATSTTPDGSTKIKTTQINVPLLGDASDMTLNDLVAEINAVADVSASVAPSGAIRIKSTNTNVTIGFSEDTSGVLAALGVNTFFTGSSASSIGVNETVATDKRMIAVGATDAPGNGEIAGKIAALGDSTNGLPGLNGSSLLQYHQELVTDVAVWTNNAQNTAIASGVVYDSLSAQRESLSGVSIDEEAVNLMQYQRGFQGAARFISVVNELLDEIMSLL